MIEADRGLGSLCHGVRASASWPISDHDFVVDRLATGMNGALFCSGARDEHVEFICSGGGRFGIVLCGVMYVRMCG